MRDVGLAEQFRVNPTPSPITVEQSVDRECGCASGTGRFNAARMNNERKNDSRLGVHFARVGVFRLVKKTSTVWLLCHDSRFHGTPQSRVPHTGQTVFDRGENEVHGPNVGRVLGGPPRLHFTVAQAFWFAYPNCPLLAEAATEGYGTR